MSAQSRRRTLRAVAPVAGLLAAGLLVWQGSYAAFSATTDNAGNSWAAGSVKLRNDGAGGSFAVSSTPAAFTVAAIKPGDSGAKCIVVESTADIGNLVKLETANVSSNALSGAMTMKIDFAAGQFANCASFPASPTNVYNSTLSGLAAATNWSNGLGNWSAGTGTKYGTYRFSWALPGGATAGMGQTATADFIWEQQSS